MASSSPEIEAGSSVASKGPSDSGAAAEDTSR